jgi:hypothetical protein
VWNSSHASRCGGGTHRLFPNHALVEGLLPLQREWLIHNVSTFAK